MQIDEQNSSTSWDRYDKTRLRNMSYIFNWLYVFCPKCWEEMDTRQTINKQRQQQQQHLRKMGFRICSTSVGRFEGCWGTKKIDGWTLWTRWTLKLEDIGWISKMIKVYSLRNHWFFSDNHKLLYIGVDALVLNQDLILLMKEILHDLGCTKPCK